MGAFWRRSILGIVVFVGCFALDARAIELKNPSLGSLTIGQDADLAKADVAKLAPLFASVQESASETPKCDVLLLYARIEPDGTVHGSSKGLTAIIRESGARIVVIASENPADHYLATKKTGPHKGIFLVMTLGRSGDVFAAFFEQLFSRMKKGMNVVAAWVELVPQGPPNPAVKPAVESPEVFAATDVRSITFAR